MEVQVFYRKYGEHESKLAYARILQNSDGTYYAMELALWGCGKNAPTIREAVRLLVQDQATILQVR